MFTINKSDFDFMFPTEYETLRDSEKVFISLNKMVFLCHRPIDFNTDKNKTILYFCNFAKYQSANCPAN